jgi:DNA topoisomerase-1
MSELRAIAGDCTAVYDDGVDREEHRGRVLTVVKPDNTVLIHDVDGYQPVAWLTRADAVSVGGADADYVVVARSGDQRLRVAVHDEDAYVAWPATPAGVPVGPCPDCNPTGGDGTLVRAGGRVTCTACAADYRLPRDAVVRDARCSCGRPRLRVERGAAFDVCLDRECEPLDDVVAAAFDREWDCPTCGNDLEILRRRGLVAGCEHYDDCGTAFRFPTGIVIGECDCGLPAFDTPAGRRCLDGTCDRVERSVPAGD